MGLGMGIGIGLWNNVAAQSGGGGSPATGWSAATSAAGFAISGTNNSTATWSSGAGNAIARANNSHSGTGDWTYSVVPSGGTANHIIGLANASELTGNFLGETNNSIGIQFSTGDVLKNGAAVASPGFSWAMGDTVIIELKNNFLYIRKVHSGTTTNILGDATAQTGGYDVTSMGALFPAVNTNNNLTFTGDFTSWP